MALTRLFLLGAAVSYEKEGDSEEEVEEEGGLGVMHVSASITPTFWLVDTRWCIRAWR